MCYISTNQQKMWMSLQRFTMKPTIYGTQEADRSIVGFSAKGVSVEPEELICVVGDDVERVTTKN